MMVISRKRNVFISAIIFFLSPRAVFGSDLWVVSFFSILVILCLNLIIGHLLSFPSLGQRMNEFRSHCRYVRYAFGKMHISPSVGARTIACFMGVRKCDFRVRLRYRRCELHFLPGYWTFGSFDVRKKAFIIRSRVLVTCGLLKWASPFPFHTVID